MKSSSRSTSLGRMMAYSTGECANSLIMNGLFGFAMLYYTKALGLSPSLAGLAMSVSVFWEAITDPVMGYVSDRTRSRFGLRHPWMILGGALMAVTFYFVWAVPQAIIGHSQATFWYLVTMNLILRTGLTMFFIPYMALGFELVTDYQQRATLQGLRQAFNMAANFAGPAMAWSIFFQNQHTTEGTDIAANYVHMGGAFSVATAIFVAFVIVATWSQSQDTRNLPPPKGGGEIAGFFSEMKSILADPYPRWVFVFIFILAVGMVLVSSLQMYVYVDFMRFSPEQKSIAHGGTMAGMGLGALLSSWLVKRFEKKGAVLIGGALSIICNLTLATLFLTGFVPHRTLCLVGSVEITLPLLLFVVFHSAYWFGNGIMLPISNAMMADVSEINRIKTGVNKDGGYAAVFSLALRLAISLGLIVSGYVLERVGFQTGADKVQSADVVWRIGAATFLAGSLICAAALLAIRRYGVDEVLLRKLRLGAEEIWQPATVKP